MQLRVSKQTEVYLPSKLAVLPAAWQMPLAAVGTWGRFEPGYVCRAVSWALELVELVG